MESKAKKMPTKKMPGKKAPAAKKTRLSPMKEAKASPAKPQAKKPRLLSLKEAASLVDGLTQYRLRKLCIDGQIKFYKFGNRYMISEREILRYFDETA